MDNRMELGARVGRLGRNGRVDRQAPDGTLPPQHFSMIRSFHLADVFTLANGCCGTAAIFLAMRHMRDAATERLYAAGALIFLALAFDVADGRVARWRHRASPLGRELDSLADVISFGVAPACLAYAVGMTGLIDELALLYFVACGISRLARYNITAEAMSAATGKVTFRGDAHPHHRSPRSATRGSRGSRPDRRRTPVRLGPGRSQQLSPPRPHVRPLGLADDQQDAAHPQALRCLPGPTVSILSPTGGNHEPWASRPHAVGGLVVECLPLDRVVATAA
jgi:CDP-diacylglycerol---serine O-phosphatidyltransferase